MTVDYLQAVPDIFKKRRGIDNRRPRTEATMQLLRFVAGDDPMCLLTCKTEAEAKTAVSTISSYVNKQKIGVRVLRRGEKILLIKKGADKK